MTSINTNTSASLAALALARNERTMATAMERLSTGLRINAAKDDAAGLAIAKKMAANVSGMQMGIRNLNDGISMIQTIEGAYQEAVNMVGRMRELAVQAATGTLTDADRANLDAEYQSLKQGIQDIAKNTQWNGMNLIDGSSTQQTVQLHNGTTTQDIQVNQLYGEPASSNFTSRTGITIRPIFSNKLSAGDVISFYVDDKYVAVTLEDKPNLIFPIDGWLQFTSEADKMFYKTTRLDGTGNLSWNFTDSFVEGLKSIPVRFEYGFDKTTITDIPSVLDLITWGGINQLGIEGNANDVNLVNLNVTDISTSRGDTKYLAITKVDSISHAQTAIVQLDDTIKTMTESMSKLGSNISGLESSTNSLMNGVVNLQQSQSRIEDADYAAETTNLARTSIIAQASTALLAQANQTKETVLALLK